MFQVRLSRRRRRQLLVFAGAGAVGAYFVYHAVYGDAGYMAWRALEAERAAIEAEYGKVQTTNASLQAAIEGLRPDRIDPDAVEGALRELGYVRPEEMIVLEPAH